MLSLISSSWVLAGYPIAVRLNESIVLQELKRTGSQACRLFVQLRSRINTESIGTLTATMFGQDPPVDSTLDEDGWPRSVRNYPRSVQWEELDDMSGVHRAYAF